jgi:hypothetical protein
MFANGGFIVLQGHAIAPGDKWNKILGILSDRTLSAAQKVPLLKAFGLLESGQGLDYANYALPMTNFLATTQLWTRVAGDVSWTNDAPQMLHRLTNGWARISPKWVREPSIAPVPVATNPAPVAAVAPTPPPPPSPRTNAPPAVLTNAPSAVVRTAPPVRKSPPPPPRAKRAESSAPIWLIGMGALAAIVVLGWLLFRGRRS